MKQAVLKSFSEWNGLLSTLLLHLLANEYKVTALSFDYGQKHNSRIRKSTRIS